MAQFHLVAGRDGQGADILQRYLFAEVGDPIRDVVARLVERILKEQAGGNRSG